MSTKMFGKKAITGLALSLALFGAVSATSTATNSTLATYNGTTTLVAAGPAPEQFYMLDVGAIKHTVDTTSTTSRINPDIKLNVEDLSGCYIVPAEAPATVARCGVMIVKDLAGEGETIERTEGDEVVLYKARGHKLIELERHTLVKAQPTPSLASKIRSRLGFGTKTTSTEVSTFVRPRRVRAFVSWFLKLADKLIYRLAHSVKAFWAAITQGPAMIAPPLAVQAEVLDFNISWDGTADWDLGELGFDWSATASEDFLASLINANVSRIVKNTNKPSSVTSLPVASVYVTSTALPTMPTELAVYQGDVATVVDYARASSIRYLTRAADVAYPAVDLVLTAPTRAYESLATATGAMLESATARDALNKIMTEADNNSKNSKWLLLAAITFAPLALIISAWILKHALVAALSEFVSFAVAVLDLHAHDLVYDCRIVWNKELNSAFVLAAIARHFATVARKLTTKAFEVCNPNAILDHLPTISSPRLIYASYTVDFDRQCPTITAVLKYELNGKVNLVGHAARLYGQPLVGAAPAPKFIAFDWTNVESKVVAQYLGSLIKLSKEELAARDVLADVLFGKYSLNKLATIEIVNLVTAHKTDYKHCNRTVALPSHLAIRRSEIKLARNSVEVCQIVEVALTETLAPPKAKAIKTTTLPKHAGPLENIVTCKTHFSDAIAAPTVVPATIDAAAYADYRRRYDELFANDALEEAIEAAEEDLFDLLHENLAHYYDQGHNLTKPARLLSPWNFIDSSKLEHLDDNISHAIYARIFAGPTPTLQTIAQVMAEDDLPDNTIKLFATGTIDLSPEVPHATVDLADTFMAFVDTQVARKEARRNHTEVDLGNTFVGGLAIKENRARSRVEIPLLNLGDTIFAKSLIQANRWLGRTRYLFDELNLTFMNHLEAAGEHTGTMPIVVAEALSPAKSPRGGSSASLSEDFTQVTRQIPLLGSNASMHAPRNAGHVSDVPRRAPALAFQKAIKAAIATKPRDTLGRQGARNGSDQAVDDNHIQPAMSRSDQGSAPSIHAAVVTSVPSKQVPAPTVAQSPPGGINLSRTTLPRKPSQETIDGAATSMHASSPKIGSAPNSGKSREQSSEASRWADPATKVRAQEPGPAQVQADRSHRQRRAGADKTNLRREVAAPSQPSDRSGSLWMDGVTESNVPASGYAKQGEKVGWARDRGRHAKSTTRNKGW